MKLHTPVHRIQPFSILMYVLKISDLQDKSCYFCHNNLRVTQFVTATRIQEANKGWFVWGPVTAETAQKVTTGGANVMKITNMSKLPLPEDIFVVFQRHGSHSTRKQSSFYTELCALTIAPIIRIYVCGGGAKFLRRAHHTQAKHDCAGQLSSER